MAATLVLVPIFEADFHPCSYGFRPKWNATQALETLRRRGARGGTYVLDADIRDYFGCIDHGKLMTLVARRISAYLGVLVHYADDFAAQLRETSRIAVE